MGGGSSGTTQQQGTTHQVTKVELPEWVNKAGQENVAEAGRIAALPYQPYEGTVVPDFSQMTQDTLDWMLSNAGTYQPMYNEAGNTTRDLIAKGGVQRGDIKQYMNPYTDNVERRVIDNMSRKGEQDQRAITQDATTKRAFGGSRQAIQQAVQGAETVRGIGDMSAQLRERAYNAGQAAQQADWGRQFKNTEQTGALAKQQADLAKMAQQGLTADYFQMLSGGKMLEDHQREQLEETYRKFVEKRDYPKEGLALRLAALGMTPYGRTETTDKTESSSSKSKQSSGIDFGSLLSSGVGLLGMFGMPSDRDLKTNIEKLGTDPDTKLPVYAYDYKADVKAKKVMPGKRIGYMAQDVEKKYPKAVKKIAGKRIIDFSQLPLG
jgi:ketosteroid isomerase-like protein